MTDAVHRGESEREERPAKAMADRLAELEKKAPARAAGTRRIAPAVGKSLSEFESHRMQLAIDKGSAPGGSTSPFPSTASTRTFRRRRSG